MFRRLRRWWRVRWLGYWWEDDGRLREIERYVADHWDDPRYD